MLQLKSETDMQVFVWVGVLNIFVYIWYFATFCGNIMMLFLILFRQQKKFKSNIRAIDHKQITV